MSSNERYNYFSMFTPEGKVLPIESVIRSTEHGGVCVALRNKTSGLIIAQKMGKQDKFTEGKSKVKQLDEYLVYTYSGITNDGVQFGERLKRKLQKEKHRTGTVLSIAQLVEEQQFHNGLEVMRYGNRAPGVSVIILGVEKSELVLMEMTPTGETIPSFGCCIGARAQSARTILDSQGDRILGMSDSELLELGMSAFRNAINNPEVLSGEHYDIVQVSLSTGVCFQSPSSSSPSG
ncbi:20S proteasome subunit alpha 6 [Nematocida homosporus]|uniref:20S proteasome subunit alpha 6 n=1 Tax=Nematocida homosporus TaxID=1912981 RepID=UPI00221E6F6B|nr:20S proteasome subunit alpha 6 [Nematocida homosporus]KAI5187028.1 20S proteasome subunit alpha 6 [Nematocida homosporus]